MKKLLIKNGYYGEFGGAYIPEMLYPNIKELQDNYEKIINSSTFKKSYKKLLSEYVGRPSPLYYAKNLSEIYQTNILLKREDLNHTGSHKINNTIGQILLAAYLGKKHIIAETGAGQHGVATATVAALFGLKCTIFMGKTDIDRQEANVHRIKMLGAEVVAVESGNKTLKDAVNEALRYWISHPDDTYYIIGSVVGPHPYPDIVARFQSVISEEISIQIKKYTDSPDKILACVGGGSNAAGAFFHFIENKNVGLYAAEAAGKGINTNKHAASILKGSIGIIHAAKTYLLQDDDGQIIEPYSISAGLDYPGVGPLHAYLHDTKRAEYIPVSDTEALEAAFLLSKKEGIIPALESAHAIALLDKLNISRHEHVVIILSGRGDKDLNTYLKFLKS